MLFLLHQTVSGFSRFCAFFGVFRILNFFWFLDVTSRRTPPRTHAHTDRYTCKVTPLASTLAKTHENTVNTLLGITQNNVVSYCQQPECSSTITKPNSNKNDMKLEPPTLTRATELQYVLLHQSVQCYICFSLILFLRT